MAQKIETKKSNAGKIALIVCASVVALLVVLTVIWMFTSYVPSAKYVDAIKERGVESWKDTASSSFGFDSTRYQFYIGRPGWLSWSSHLAISMPSDVGADGFAISPDGVNAKVIGGKVVEYTADISVVTLQGMSLKSTLYYFKVDKSGNLIDNSLSEDALEVYESHKANIKNLVRKINSIWGFID